MRSRIELSVALAMALAAPALLARGAEAPAKVTYDDQVRPIFREHCLNCHNSDAKKGDLALDSFAAMMRGGSTGQVVAPSDPDGSRLWALVNHSDEPKMPPEQDKLPAAKLQIIKAWLAGGALENSGSVAKPAKKPAIDLAASAGAGKPAGEPVMPVGLFRQPVVTTVRPGAIAAMAASPWAPLLAVAGQKQILLYNTDTARLIGVLPFPEGTPFVLKFSRSGSLLLAGGGQGARQGRVIVFDVHDGKRVFEVGDELDAVLAADINEDHTRIALGGPSKVVRVFSTADGSLAYEIRKHTDWIYAVEFSPDGVLLATADRSAGVFVWEAQTGREFQNLQGHKGPVTDLSWRSDSNLLATGSEDGSIKIWEMENGTQAKSWAAHPGGVTSVRFARDGRLASTGRDRTTKLWDASGGQVRAFEALGDIALRVAVSHDSARVVAGDWLGEVRVWSASDGARVANLSANPPLLETLVAEETAKLAAATKKFEEATAALNGAQQSLDAQSRAAQSGSEALAAAQTTAQTAAREDQAAKAALAREEAEEKAASDRLAAAKVAAEAAGPNDPALNAALSDRQNEFDKAALEKSSVAATLAPLEAALKAAEARVAELQRAMPGLTAAKNAAEKALGEKTAARKAAEDALSKTRAALDAIAAEKAAYDAAHVAGTTASKPAG